MTMKMSSLYSPVSVSVYVLCALCSVVLTIYSKDQVLAVADIRELHAAEHCRVFVSFFFFFFSFPGIEWKVVMVFVIEMSWIRWSL